MRNIGVFNNTLASNQEKAPRTVGKRKNLSVSAPSVPAEQFSTSVLAEQLSAIEVGVKNYTWYTLITIIFTGALAPVVPTPLNYSRENYCGVNMPGHTETVTFDVFVHRFK